MKLIHPEQQYSEIEVCPQQDRICVFITRGNAIVIQSNTAEGKHSVILEASYIGALIRALETLEKDL